MSSQATYFRKDCHIKFEHDKTTDTCTIIAPFDGGGEYVFYATFKSDGRIVAQQIVDPSVEPNWH